MIKQLLILISIISFSSSLWAQELDNKTKDSLSRTDIDTSPLYFRASSSSVEKKHTDSSNKLFALKTNLLFDLASLVNLEIEVPIGKRFSVAGEFIFPCWTMDNGRADSKRNMLQILNGNLEGRYWFGNRTDKPKMTEWFAGVYIGGGVYNFEYHAKGYQGEFFIVGGVSGGYAHTINKKENLRMEYSLGVGYMLTDYKYYESHFSNEREWHAIHKEDGRYTWLGPTKAKVSLVWMIK